MWNPGDWCERIENRPTVRAQVLTVNEWGAVEIAYIEGGTGWWPPDALTPAPAEP